MSDQDGKKKALEAAWRAAKTQRGETLWDIAAERRTLVILLRHLG